jgi:hypothetical protein
MEGDDEQDFTAKSRTALKPAIQRVVCITGCTARSPCPRGDLLIHAGDFMRMGTSLEEIADFNDWLGEQPHPHKVVVAGNHDLLFEISPDKAREHLTNAVYLENDGIVLGGVTFWGSPMTPVFANWAFQVKRGAASRRYWDRIPSRHRCCHHAWATIRNARQARYSRVPPRLSGAD